jgi:hypothetical protein
MEIHNVCYVLETFLLLLACYMHHARSNRPGLIRYHRVIWREVGPLRVAGIPSHFCTQKKKKGRRTAKQRKPIPYPAQ